jgi:PAS domain S-box-containing protein
LKRIDLVRDEAAATERVAWLEAENAALRRALARVGLDAERAAERHEGELSEARAGGVADAAGAGASAAEAGARHGREMAAGRADLAAAEGANEALRRANAELASNRAALREREERLRLIFDSATDYAIFSMGLDRRVTSWNEGAERLLGWSEDEIVGRPADAIFTPEDRAGGAPAEEAEGALRDGRAADERWHRRKDDTRFWANGLMLPLRDPAAGPGAPPLGLLKIMRDETGKRRAEEVLRESEARFRALTRASSDVLYRMSPDWAEMRQLCGGGFIADAKSPTRGWIEDYIQPVDRPLVRAAIDEAVRSKGVFELEHRVLRPDGGLGWTHSRAVPILDADGEIAEWFGAARDVSARKAAEEALREVEARQTFLLRLADTLRPLHDPEEVQAEACRLLGAYLGVAQVGFGEVDAAQERVTVRREWNDGRVPSVVGTWRLDDFGHAFAADLRRGATVAIPDIARDPRTDAPEVVAAYVGIGARAILDVPLVKGGRMAAMLFIHHPEPRPWSAADLGVVEETCERLWAAVERAHAEERLRASEARWRGLFERMHEGFMLCEMVYGPDGRAVDYCHLELNAAWGRLIGIPREAAQGRLVSEAIPGLDPFWIETYARVVEAGEPAHVERFVPGARPLVRGAGPPDRAGAVRRPVHGRDRAQAGRGAEGAAGGRTEPPRQEHPGRGAVARGPDRARRRGPALVLVGVPGAPDRARPGPRPADAEGLGRGAARRGGAGGAATEHRPGRGPRGHPGLRVGRAAGARAGVGFGAGAARTRHQRPEARRPVGPRRARGPRLPRR